MIEKITNGSPAVLRGECPYLWTYGVCENEGADAGTADPPPCTEAKCIAEPCRSNGRSGANVGCKKCCANQAGTESASGNEKIISFLHSPRDEKPHSDEEHGVNDERRELVIHLPDEKKMMCCHGRNSSER